LRFLSLLPEFVPAAKAVHTQLTEFAAAKAKLLGLTE
jgi:hypothetical protein